MGQEVKKERLEDSRPQLPGQISIPRTALVAPFSIMQRLLAKPNALEFVTPLLGVPFFDLYAPRLAEPSEIHLASSSFRFVPDLVWMVLEYELAIFTTDSEYICVLLHS
jgi:hypothetical protein